MIERIVGGKTQEQIRTSDVALHFELLLLTVVCGIGEQAHGGLTCNEKKSFLPRAIHKYASPTFWMLLQNVANVVLRKKKKKHCCVHLLGICATVDTLQM